MSIDASAMSMMEDWFFEFIEEGLSEEDAAEAVRERYEQMGDSQ
jgi:hypothetical protein